MDFFPVLFSDCWCQDCFFAPLSLFGLIDWWYCDSFDTDDSLVCLVSCAVSTWPSCSPNTRSWGLSCRCCPYATSCWAKVRSFDLWLAVSCGPRMPDESFLWLRVSFSSAIMNWGLMSPMLGWVLSLDGIGFYLYAYDLWSSRFLMFCWFRFVLRSLIHWLE